MGYYYIDNCFYVGQSTATTCWRACYEMLLRYKVRDPKDAWKVPNHDKMCVRGILDSEFAACASCLGLGGIRYTFFQDIKNLEHALRCWGPLWISGFYADGHKHVVAVRGVDTDDMQVIVNDPWRTYAGAKAKPTTWSFSYFTNHMNPVPWACQLWY